MERKIAERLIEELDKQPYIIKPDKEMLIDILEITNVPESPGFYEPIQIEQALEE